MASLLLQAQIRYAPTEQLAIAGVVAPALGTVVLLAVLRVASQTAIATHTVLHSEVHLHVASQTVTATHTGTATHTALPSVDQLWEVNLKAMAPHS